MLGTYGTVPVDSAKAAGAHLGLDDESLLEVGLLLGGVIHLGAHPHHHTTTNSTVWGHRTAALWIRILDANFSFDINWYGLEPRHEFKKKTFKCKLQ